LSLQQWLRKANKAQRRGRLALDHEDFETAFVEMVKALIIVVQRVPDHDEYQAILNPGQMEKL
ncbi:hypothetical protein K488DRAFT_13395, partial [Vararia minispora EC-137]